MEPASSLHPRTKRADDWVAKRSSISLKCSKQATWSLNRQSATSNLASELQDRVQVLDHFPEEEESTTSDLLVDLNAEPMEPMELSDAVFALAQLAAIHNTVSSTVQAASQSLPHNDVIPPAPACARVFQHSKSSCSFCGVSEQPQSSLAQSTRVFFILSNNYVLNLPDNFLDTKREFRLKSGWTFHWIGHSGPCSVYSLTTSALGICTDGEKQFCICQKILI